MIIAFVSSVRVHGSTPDEKAIGDNLKIRDHGSILDVVVTIIVSIARDLRLDVDPISTRVLSLKLTVFSPTVILLMSD